MNNLKVIGLALHYYHDEFGTFPPSYTVDQDGSPLHSWRTLLLPYLKQDVLYSRIKLDEPWDSVHNRQFAEEQLSVYSCPKGDGGLSYLAVATSGSLFEGALASPFEEITDGSSNTIAVIEVKPRSNSWMQPVDFDQRELDRVLAEGLFSPHPGCSLVLFADASVRVIAATVDRQTFEASLTRAGGEQLPHFNSPDDGLQTTGYFQSGNCTPSPLATPLNCRCVPCTGGGNRRRLHPARTELASRTSVLMFTM